MKRNAPLLVLWTWVQVYCLALKYSFMLSIELWCSWISCVKSRLGRFHFRSWVLSDFLLCCFLVCWVACSMICLVRWSIQMIESLKAMVFGVIYTTIMLLGEKLAALVCRLQLKLALAFSFCFGLLCSPCHW